MSYTITDITKFAEEAAKKELKESLEKALKSAADKIIPEIIANLLVGVEVYLRHSSIPGNYQVVLSMPGLEGKNISNNN